VLAGVSPSFRKLHASIPTFAVVLVDPSLIALKVSIPLRAVLEGLDIRLA
jgi:hypothetical protein